MASLTYRAPESFVESYADRGTGAKQNLSVWQPRLLDDEYRVMYVATNKRDTNSLSTAPVVVKERKSSNGMALAQPIHFEIVWTDRHTGGHTNGQIYKAVAPEGYVALSDVAIFANHNDRPPGSTFAPDVIDKDFRCVHKSLVVSVELGSLRWTDSGSGGTFNGAVWDISESAGFKAGRGKSNRPPNQQWRLDYIPGPLYKRMNLVSTFSNTTDVPITRTITRKIGTTITKTDSTSIKAGISSTIGTKASAGVKDISSVEVSESLTTFMEGVTSFSMEESSTKMYEDITSYIVNPRRKFTMWQLCVSDAKDETDPSLFELQSMHTKITSEEIPKTAQTQLRLEPDTQRQEQTATHDQNPTAGNALALEQHELLKKLVENNTELTKYFTSRLFIENTGDL